MIQNLVINCSAPKYNLGAHKLADWLRANGEEAELAEGDPGPLLTIGYDRICLSVIFSWHALIAREIAFRVRDFSEVWCGGPGMYALTRWWQNETGLSCVRGLDSRFERQRGDYLMTFASRGCPVGCYFCIVPRLEGKDFTLYEDFQPAPILCDNNLSALPVEFQEHIIARYKESGVRLRDANSGFEPRTFEADTYERWKEIIPVWRFAYDEENEGEYVQRMMCLLSNLPARRKQVYVLIGNEPIASCYARVQRVIAWGGEPHCQAVMPLHALDKHQFTVRFDWTTQHLRDFQRWANGRIWRSVPLREYCNRKGETPPFAGIAG